MCRQNIMKKQRIDIARYTIIKRHHIFKETQDSCPIEYHFLLQQYNSKLMPFYTIAKDANIPNDVIARILKIMYGPYFLWHNECNKKSHRLGVEYLIEKQRETFNLCNKSGQSNWNLLNPQIEELLKCECCILQKRCKYNECKTLVLETSNYCRKHMQCEKCYHNMRLKDCNCKNIPYKLHSYKMLGLNGPETALKCNPFMNLDYGIANQLMIPISNTSKRYFVFNQGDRTVLNMDQ